MGPPGTPSVKPGGWWYLVPVTLAIVAVVGFGVAIRRGFADAERAGLEASAAAPGVDQTITIVEPGGYTIAYSGPLLIFDTVDQERVARTLEISIVPADGGAPLELRAYEGLNDIEADDQQYVPLHTVRFEEPGDYVLRSSTTSEADPRQAALVVSESPWRKLRSGVARAAVILVVGILLAILAAVILARIRGRAMTALRALAPPSQPWPPPGGPWGGQPQGPWGGAPGPQRGAWGGGPSGWPPR